MSQKRYLAAAHGMQAGVAMEMGFPERQSATEPKHLRVGINSAMSDHCGLVKLLIDKGVITEAEYMGAITEAMEQERDRYERSLSERLGKPVKLF